MICLSIFPFCGSVCVVCTALLCAISSELGPDSDTSPQYLDEKRPVRWFLMLLSQCACTCISTCKSVVTDEKNVIIL